MVNMTDFSPKITKLICITCPMGCRLTVTHEGDTVVSVQENACARGVAYAQAELRDPRRMVTTTVQVRGGTLPLLPVYTELPFPKGQIFDLLAVLRRVEVQAPVQAGQVICENALETGIRVLASRSLEAISPIGFVEIGATVLAI